MSQTSRSTQAYSAVWGFRNRCILHLLRLIEDDTVALHSGIKRRNDRIHRFNISG